MTFPLFQILDATNTTRDRRDLILEKITPEGIQVLFIESVLDDVQIEEMNIRVSGVFKGFSTVNLFKLGKLLLFSQYMNVFEL